jgi:hypothetical protein
MDKEVVEVGNWVWSKGQLRRVVEIDKAEYSTLVNEDDEIVARHEPVKKLTQDFKSEIAGITAEQKRKKKKSK